MSEGCIRDIRLWRRRGFYSERVLVQLLARKGYKAVRIPVSNPSKASLPDVFASKGSHIYAFEVKNQDYYVYIEKKQLDKLFRFLDMFPLYPWELKHAVIACHFGKKWVFKEVKKDEYDKLAEKEVIRIIKRSRGNWQP
jgi:Holliday junction resolvase